MYHIMMNTFNFLKTHALCGGEVYKADITRYHSFCLLKGFKQKCVGRSLICNVKSLPKSEIYKRLKMPLRFLQPDISHCVFAREEVFLCIRKNLKNLL